jgi:hypothetical protein
VDIPDAPAETGRTFTSGSWSLCLILTVLIAVAGVAPVAAHDETDVVVLTNGDRYTGEIKSVGQAILTLKTSAASTISVKWTHVASLTSSYDYRVEVTSGEHYFGTLAAPDQSGEVKIVGPEETYSVPLSDIFSILPIDHGFWRKLHGSVNFGFSYTQSNKAIQYSLSANSLYWTRKILSQVKLNSTFNTQEGADSASQQSLAFLFTRTLKESSGLFGVGQLQSNPDQGFDLRWIAGGGYDRFLMKRSNGYFIVNAGLVHNREQVIESSRVDNSAEALVGLQFADYSDDHPKRTITLSFYTFTNITDPPRFRAQLNFSLSWTVFHNFDVSFNLIDNYDSKPPTVGAIKNDFSLNMSIGYTY